MKKKAKAAALKVRCLWLGFLREYQPLWELKRAISGIRAILLGSGKEGAEETHEESQGQEGSEAGQEIEKVQEGGFRVGICLLGIGRQL